MEYEVLHLRVAEVEHHLRAATSALKVAVGSLYNPFGMLLEEFALGVRHLRLEPYTELYALLLGFGKKALNAVRQLVLVYYPVTQCTVVDASLVLIAKPSVVHNEQFAPHRLDVCHHLRHLRLLDVEINALPRVEQNLALYVAVHQFVLASPAVEVAAHTAQSLLAVGEGCDGSGEGLALGQVILRIVLVDAGKELVVFRLIGHGTQLVVARIADSGTDYTPRVLLTLTVEREHNLATRSMCIACSVAVFNYKCARLKLLLRELRLVCPCTVEVRHPYVATAYGQIGRVKLRESDGCLLAIVYLCPHLYNVHIVVGTVAHCDVERIYTVLELNLQHLGILLRSGGIAVYIHLESHVAVGMTHRKGSSRFAYHAIYRISVLASRSASLECGYVGV